MVRAEQERVRQLLTEAVGLLCRNSLQFDEEVQVEGLIGITLDKSDILLVSIRETFESAAAQLSRKVSEEKVAQASEDQDRPSSPSKRKRRRSRDSDGAASHTSSDAKRPTAQDVVIKSEVTDSPYPERPYDNQTDMTMTYVEPVKREQHAGAHVDSDRNVSIPQPGPSYDPDPGQAVTVKEEAEDEADDDECFMISDEDEDLSNQSGSLSHFEGQLQQMEASNNWAGGDSSFGLDTSQPGSQLAWPIPPSGGQHFDPTMAGAEMLAQGQMPEQDGNKFWLSDICPTCGKKLSSPKSMRQHMSDVHLKQKPFMCPICGRGFSQRSNMKSHAKRVHPIHGN